MKRNFAIIIAMVVWSTCTHAQDFGQKPFSNPAFMLGTDLGKYVQTLYKLNKVDEMIKFTSSETVRKYGVQKIRKYYETCGFGYEITLVSMSGDGKYRILTYSAKINATNNIVRMKTVVENDTAKVVLDNLHITY
jgi:hypothetical protein